MSFVVNNETVQEEGVVEEEEAVEYLNAGTIDGSEIKCRLESILIGPNADLHPF